MEKLVIAWYGWLSALTQGTVFRLQGWTDSIQLPILTAAVLGLIGATSPCQLTTNPRALVYAATAEGRIFVSGDGGQTWEPVR